MINPLDDLMKQRGEWIRVYLGKEIIQDPLEGDTVTIYHNPIPVKAIITDLLPAKIQWVLPGIRTEKAKELIIERKKRSILEKSQKIEIRNEEYVGWRENVASTQIERNDDYIRVIVYTRTNS